jgi:hypothetical protein
MPRTLPVICLGIILSFFSHPVFASDEPLVQRLRDGETKRIYWAVNLKGFVFLSIRGRAGAGCARVFWRPIPNFGRTITLNDVCGNTRIEIPGASNWAIGGELYARANVGEVAIILSSVEQVAYDFPPFEIP